MKRTVPMGKGPAVLLFALISPIVIAFILCSLLDAPFLVTLILGVLSGLLYFIVYKSTKQLAKTNLAEIYETKVRIAIDGKLESFDYSDIKDFKLVKDEGLFKDGIYVIFTDDAIEWILASNASNVMKNRYKNWGTIAVIPAFSSGMPIEVVYSTLKKQLEAYQNSHNAITNVDDTENYGPVTDLIDDVDEMLDAMEEGYAEGERIANRISKIFRL